MHNKWYTTWLEISILVYNYVCVVGSNHRISSFYSELCGLSIKNLNYRSIKNSNYIYIYIYIYISLNIAFIIATLLLSHMSSQIIHLPQPFLYYFLPFFLLIMFLTATLSLAFLPPFYFFFFPLLSTLISLFLHLFLFLFILALFILILLL